MSFISNFKRRISHEWSRFLKIADQGFMLTEIAIALAVLGILVGLSLPLITHMRHVERHQVTRKNQEYILKTLGLYVTQRHALPCPAQRDASGVMREDKISCEQNGLWFGYIPYRTLGIPESMTKDGYGHPMRLAVHAQMVRNNSYCGELAVDPFDMHQLQVLNQQGQSVIELSKDQFVVVILIAEGEGYAAPKSAAERENLAASAIFHDRSFSQNPADLFRHTVAWVSWQQLAGHYGQKLCPKTDLQHQSPHSMTGKDPFQTPVYLQRNVPVSPQGSRPDDLQWIKNMPDPLFYHP